MKPRSYFAVTFIFALFVCFAFQTLPELEVNRVQAQDLPPMPTYDDDPDDPDTDFPDISVSGVPDGYLFRTVVCRIGLIVNAEDVNELLEGTGYVVFDPVARKPAVGEAQIQVDWNYRLFSQWPEYTSSTNETIGSVSIGVLTFKPFVGLRYLMLADVQSPGSAVELTNSTAGWDHRAEVSREGILKMAFESETKRNGESTLKFKAKVKEPISGLKIEVNAILPEEQASNRLVKNFTVAKLLVIFMDLSKFPAMEGRPFRSWTQKDEYWFDHNTQDFKLKVKIPGKKLKLPGGRVLEIIRISESLSLRRNDENYFQFVVPED
jgi:hypothetical protein